MGIKKYTYEYVKEYIEGFGYKYDVHIVKKLAEN